MKIYKFHFFYSTNEYKLNINLLMYINNKLKTNYQLTITGKYDEVKFTGNYTKCIYLP